MHSLQKLLQTEPETPADPSAEQPQHNCSKERKGIFVGLCTRVVDVEPLGLLKA